MSAATTPIVQQAYRFELDPNQAQRVLLAKSVGASRFVYNWGLEQSQSEYERLGKRPQLGELKSRLVDLKKGECPWLYEIPRISASRRSSTWIARSTASSRA
jgi:putative transposase